MSEAKTAGQIGREAYEAKWREVCGYVCEPFDRERDCSPTGDAADEACAAAVIAHHEEQMNRREDGWQALIEQIEDEVLPPVSERPRHEIGGGVLDAIRELKRQATRPGWPPMRPMGELKEGTPALLSVVKYGADECEYRRFEIGAYDHEGFVDERGMQIDDVVEGFWDLPEVKR